MRRIEVGQRFGRLVTLAKISARASGHVNTRWLCLCVCGKHHVVVSGSIGVSTFSCGCLFVELTKQRRLHGMKNTPTWNSWHAMLQRCHDPNSSMWRYYGGRGIRIDPRWLDLRNFLADMGEKPVGTSLGRIDNDGDYVPTNCRWETPKQQNRNTRGVRRETIGETTLSVTEWAERFCIDRKRLFNYLRYYSLQESLARMGVAA